MIWAVPELVYISPATPALMKPFSPKPDEELDPKADTDDSDGSV
jgi:hypothetical protein